MSPRLFLAAGFVMAVALHPSRADDPSALPGAGFDGDRYATLWTKSPFAIATPEAAAASQDFQLVGVAQFDGISYVSLVDKQTQEHFVLTSDKPVKNLTLVSISREADGATARIQHSGELLTLREEAAAVPSSPPVSAELSTPQASAMAAPLSSVGGNIPPAYRAAPKARLHRPALHVPDPPSQ